MSEPLVSVILPVHNGGDFLQIAVASILSQTHADLELIVVNDGSTDGSVDRLAAVTDRRMKIINAVGRGLVPALNQGFAASRAQFIARMDADDISRPRRIEKQLEFFDRNPKVSLLCSDVAIIDVNGRQTGIQRQTGLNARILRDALLFRRTIKPVIHPSIMMRREVLSGLGGYRSFDGAEDHDLWLRAVDRFEFARVNDILLDYRFHPGGVSRARGSRNATASAMSAVDYLVHQHTGVGLLDDRFDLFTSTMEIVRSRIEERVVAPSQDFRVGRLKMLTGERLRGTAMIAVSLLKYGPAALPSYSTNLLGGIVMRTASDVIQTLVGRGTQ